MWLWDSTQSEPCAQTQGRRCGDGWRECRASGGGKSLFWRDRRCHLWPLTPAHGLAALVLSQGEWKPKPCSRRGACWSGPYAATGCGRPRTANTPPCPGLGCPATSSAQGALLSPSVISARMGLLAVGAGGRRHRALCREEPPPSLPCGGDPRLQVSARGGRCGLVLLLDVSCPVPMAPSLPLGQ